MDHFSYLCFVFVMLSCWFIAALWSLTCWEKANLLAILYVMFYCVFVAVPCGIGLDKHNF